MLLLRRNLSRRRLPISRLSNITAFRLGIILSIMVNSLVFPIPTGAVAPSRTMDGLHVVGNRLYNSAGEPVRLLGVNRAGTEYMCVNGWGVMDGPSDPESVAAMMSWGINAVRVPLNEHCWLGINGITSQEATAYRTAIQNWVATLRSSDLAVILDLHQNAAGTDRAISQQIMADADHAPDFWASVASTFGQDNGVVFDLYNEPHDITWRCWRDGSTACTDAPFAIVGMQTLVDIIRGTGATNVLMLGGLGWANDLSQWLEYRPNDPRENLAAAWHVYANGPYASGCRTIACWDATIAPIAAQVPLIAGEIAQQDCAADFLKILMQYLDQHNASYIAWAWNAGQSCTGFPSLITDWAGTPTGFGLGLREHLAELAAGPGPAPSPAPSPSPTPPPTPSPTPSPTPPPTPSPTPSPVPTPKTSPTPSAPESPSPTAIPQPHGGSQGQERVQLNIVIQGDGAVTTSSTGPYALGESVTVHAIPGPGMLLLTWNVDGVSHGWTPDLTLSITTVHTVIADFVPAPNFSDLPAMPAQAEAISQLAARGVIRGYPDGRFGIADYTLRAQMAALIARAMGWTTEDWGNAFADQGPVDADLWRNVGTLAHYGVARGFSDKEFGPTLDVLQAQAVSFVTRALVARGLWQLQPDNPAIYPNVPMDSGHRQDIATFVHYAGALPGTTDKAQPFANWDRASTRGWFAEVLWHALDSQYARAP